MKGRNEIFCQTTTASIFDRELQYIAKLATGRRPLP